MKHLELNLLEMVTEELGDPQTTTGRWMFFLCPFHSEHTPSFAVTADTDSYHCFGCGKSGNAHTWLRDRHGKRINRLREGRLSMAPRLAPPQSDWQKKAWQVIEECEVALWMDCGTQVREYLHKRGLSDETLRRWRIGFNTSNPPTDTGRVTSGLYVPAGILIPCIMQDQVWYLKIRLMSGVPFKCYKCRRVLSTPGKCSNCFCINKYLGVKGNVSKGLFGASTLPGHRIAVLCEGEFDAILLHQAVGDLVGVLSLGTGAASTLNVAAWAKYLLPISRILVAYDGDSAGQRGSKSNMMLSARMIEANLGGRNDITDLHQGGENLRIWLLEELSRAGIFDEERSAIMEYDGGLPRAEAERAALSI
jgi:DNA primase